MISKQLSAGLLRGKNRFMATRKKRNVREKRHPSGSPVGSLEPGIYQARMKWGPTWKLHDANYLSDMAYDRAGWCWHRMLGSAYCQRWWPKICKPWKRTPFHSCFTSHMLPLSVGRFCIFTHANTINGSTYQMVFAQVTKSICTSFPTSWSYCFPFWLCRRMKLQA